MNTRATRSRTGRCRGFTLVELLVVVGIIALLIAILLPSLSRARGQARLIKCLSNMRSIGQAAMIFANQHRDHIQVVSSEGGVKQADPHRTRFEYFSEPGHHNLEDRELLAWPVAVAQSAGYPYASNWQWGVRAKDYRDAKLQQPYIDAELEIMTCPSDKVRISTPFYPRNEGDNHGLKGAGDPNHPVGPQSAQNLAYWGLLSFGINEDIAGVDDQTPACWRAARKNNEWLNCIGSFNYASAHPCGLARYGHRLRGNLDRVDRPGDVGLIFETGPENERQYTDMLGFDEFANLVISESSDGPFLGQSQQQFPSRIPNNRHPEDRLNVLFVDGHGDTVRPVMYDTNNFYNKRLPSQYAPRVRVSPYPARGVE